MYTAIALVAAYFILWSIVVTILMERLIQRLDKLLTIHWVTTNSQCTHNPHDGLESR
jgi:hypothetical protein